MGISTEGCLIDLGLEHDFVQKSGSFFSYGETRIGQGRNNAKGFLRDNPELAKELEDKILAEVGAERQSFEVVEGGEAAADAPEGEAAAPTPEAAAPEAEADEQAA